MRIRNRANIIRLALGTAAAAVLAAGTSSPSTADPGDDASHTVRYVVTSDGAQEVTIHYRTDAPTENWHGAHYENIWISPTQPFEQTVKLDEPYTYGYIAVRTIYWSPNFHCEVWVDGKLALQGDSSCVLSEYQWKP